MKKTSYLRWAWAVVLAAILRSLDGTFLRPQLYSLPAELVVFLEHLLWTIVFAYFLWQGRKQIRKLPWKTWWALFWVALFGGVLGTLFITKAFFMAFDGGVTFATVIILQKLQPLFALIVAAVLLKEKLHKSFYLRAVVAIWAAYLLAFGTSAMTIADVNWRSQWAILALIAAFAFGSSTVFGKYVVDHLDVKRSTGMRFLLTTILIGIYILISGWVGWLEQVTNVQRWYLIVIVCSSGAVALFLYYWWLQKIKASQATILELAWPLSAIILDRAINWNMLTTTQFIAAAVMVVAMIQVGKMRN